VVHEAADLWFHCLVLLKSLDLSSDDIAEELQRRFGVSGHDEKAQRASAQDS
jgi:phosphoribosyl-ATP pyrophosphohydrolase